MGLRPVTGLENDWLPETSRRRCFALEGIGKSNEFLNKRGLDLSLYHEPA